MPGDALELRTTLGRVGVPAVIGDREGTITWSNPAADKTFGQLRGRKLTSLVAPDHRSRVQQQFDRKLQGLPATDYEADVLTLDGRRRAEISSVRIPDGNACHAVFGLVQPRERSEHSERNPMLTRRQMEVLQLLADGMSTTDIAGSLHLSPETVRNHIRHTLHALGVHSRLEAVLTAQRAGLLKSP